MGFKTHQGGEYGIHGTDNPGSVGRFSSHGCVRMKIPDAEDLYSQIRIGTPVSVVYDVAPVDKQGNQLVMAVHPDYLKKGEPGVSQLYKTLITTYPQAQINKLALQTALKQKRVKPVVIGILPESKPQKPLPEDQTIQEQTVSTGTPIMHTDEPSLEEPRPTPFIKENDIQSEEAFQNIP